MAIKIDDLYFTVKIDDSNITTVLNNTKKQMKELENVVLKSTDLDGEKLSHPFNMQALTIEQVINQMRLLEQTYKKIETPDTNPAADQMRQRWQDLQRQAEQYGITVRSALMEEATTADLLKHQSQLRSEIMAIVEKTGMIQSDTAKKIIEEQVALSTLKAERSKLNEAERMGIVSTDELSSAKARITAQEHQHKTAISQLEQQLRNEVKMNHTASGSMDELSLKLAKLRQEYRALSESARDGAIGKGMLKEITDLDGQLKGLDAGIGNYQRNIGNYASGFNGLQNAINQVGRELPSLKMGFGMFMLAISNNLPILSDELERARIRYKALKEEGLAAVPVWKQVLSALVSWQTVMVVGITLLTVYGKEISNWVTGLFKAKDGIMGLLDMQKAIDAEMSKSSGFGEQIVKLRDLQAQWDSFGDKIDEKKKFIEENKSAFEDLGISISNVGDAESALVTNTSSIIESLKLRAQAAAAYKLASEQYEKQLIKEREAEAESAKDASLWDKYRESALRGMMASEGGSVLGYSGATAEDFRKERIKDLKDEAKAAGEAGDAYFTLGEKALSAAGRISKTTTGKTTTSTAKNSIAPDGSIAFLNKLIQDTRTKLDESTTDSQRSFYKDLISDLESQLKELQNKLSLHGKNVAYEALLGTLKGVDIAVGQVERLTPQEKIFGKLDTSDLKKAADQTEKVKKNLSVARGDLVGIVKNWNEFTEQDKINAVSEGCFAISDGLSIAAEAAGELDKDLQESLQTASRLVGAVAQFAQGNYIGAGLSIISEIVTGLAKSNAEAVRTAKESEGTYWDAVNYKIEKQIELMRELSNISAEQAAGTAKQAENEVMDWFSDYTWKQKFNKGRFETFQKLIEENLKKAKKSGNDWAVSFLEGLNGFNWSFEGYGSWTAGLEGVFEGLTKEQIMSLREIPEIWSILPNDVKEYVDRLIDIDDALNEIKETEEELLTGVSFDSFLDGFISILTDMDSSAEDLANNVEKYLRNAIINGLVADEYQSKIRKLYDSFKQTNADGEISEAEYKAIQAESKKLADDIYSSIDSLKNIFQWDSSSSSKGQLESGIARATQDSIDVLAGGVLSNQGMLSELRNNSYALNIHISAQTNELKAQTAQLNLIRQYAMEVRDYNSRLVDIDENVATIVRRGVEIYG